MGRFIDLHSHIAWGIDDGMPSMEDAQSSLELARNDGIVGICSTPHIIPGQYDASIHNEIVSRQMELKEMSSIPNVIKLRDDEPSRYYCLDGIFI